MDKKTLCDRFYHHTESKDANGTLLYRTVPEPGTRMLSLGYFPTEEAAVDALYDYLTLKKLI